MTELDILMLQAQNNQGTGMYSVAMAFSIWVAFRVSGITRDKYSDNLIVKIAVRPSFLARASLSAVLYNTTMRGFAMKTL